MDKQTEQIKWQAFKHTAFLYFVILGIILAVAIIKHITQSS